MEAVPNVPAQDDARLVPQRLGERQVEIPEPQREQAAAENAGQRDPALAVVVVVGFGCVGGERLLDLSALAPHDDPGLGTGRLGAVVDPWLAHPDRRAALIELRRHERRLALGVDSTRRDRHQPVAVGVRKPVVRPCAAGALQAGEVQSARPDDDGSGPPTLAIAVDRHVAEAVVRPDGLLLVDLRLQDLAVPERDVPEHLPVRPEFLARDRGIGRDRVLRDAFEPVGDPRELERVREVGTLA